LTLSCINCPRVNAVNAPNDPEAHVIPKSNALDSLLTYLLIIIKFVMNMLKQHTTEPAYPMILGTSSSQSPLVPSSANIKREKTNVMYQGIKIVQGDYLSVLIPVIKRVGINNTPMAVPMISVYFDGLQISS
jgi:hypothetical protein